MQTAVRKTPERRCVGCGISFPKKELIRIVRTPLGTVELDFTGKKSGRGAYICKNSECFLKAKKSKRVERNLEVSSDQLSAIYEAIEQGGLNDA